MTFLKHSVETPQVSDYDQIKLNNKPVIFRFKLFVNLSWNQFLYFKIPMKSNKIHFHFFFLNRKTWNQHKSTSMLIWIFIQTWKFLLFNLIKTNKTECCITNTPMIHVYKSMYILFNSNHPVGINIHWTKFTFSIMESLPQCVPQDIYVKAYYLHIIFLTTAVQYIYITKYNI